MRRFLLRRDEDETGVSGTGYVAEGVEFSDGRVVMRWRTQPSSIGLYDSIEELIALHGHEGKTVVDFVDQGLLALMPALIVNETAVGAAMKGS